MTPDQLARECGVFTRHLAGRAPSSQVVQRYGAAHASLAGLEPRDPHGRWLLRVARITPAGCRVADAWARVGAPRSALRRKLVVLLAILEVSPPFAAELDQPRGGRALEWLRLAASGVMGLVALAIGLVIFLPVRLASGDGDR